MGLRSESHPHAFYRPGYTFSHWSTQPQKDATTYQDEEEVLNLAGEKNNGERVTLYARWTPNQYTVVLNANGGTGDDVSLDATYGQSLTLTSNAFEKDDKEFAGWSLTSGGPVRYPDSAQVQDLTTQSGGSVTLYAVWRTPLSEVQKPIWPSWSRPSSPTPPAVPPVHHRGLGHPVRRL